MNKFALLVVPGVVVGVLGSGCIIRHEEGSAGYYDSPSSSEVKSCASHDECHAGCFCELATRHCRMSDICTKDSDCKAGFRCDGRASCVPRDGTPTVDAGATTSSSLADAAPASVPDARPDAVTSCDAAAMNGGSCAPKCKFDQQCGPAARCQEGRCQRPCTSSVYCGTGAVCQDGFCQPDTSAGGQCVYANQCGAGGACINGYCHGGCERDGDCANHADVCDRGVCRPDQRPLPPCTASAQCATGQSCVDGLCRLGCGCDADCAPWGAGTVCVRGFCASTVEGVP